MKFTPDEVEAFAARLASARAALGIPRSAVVSKVDGLAEPQQLYNYETARRAPDRIEVVTGLEQALELPSGTLCRLLGLAPIGVELPVPTVEDAIASDRSLSLQARAQLVSAYRRLAR